MTNLAIAANGLRKSYGDKCRARRRRSSPSTEGTVFALLGAERRRQDHRRQDPLHAHRRRRRHGAPRRRVTTSPPTRRRSAAAIGVTGQFSAVDGLITGEENMLLMADLHHLSKPRADGPPPSSWTASTSIEAADQARLHLLRRHEAPPRHRHDPRRRPADHLPRRADHRARPPQPHTTCGRSSANSSTDGTTVFLTTQYLEEADELADRIAILHDGRIVAQGTPDELKAAVPTGLVELEFSDESDLAAARHALGQQHEVSQADTKLVIATSGSVADMADIFIRLNDRGIEPTGFAKQEPTLDDVFFKILDDHKEQRHAHAH